MRSATAVRPERRDGRAADAVRGHGRPTCPAARSSGRTGSWSSAGYPHIVTAAGKAYDERGVAPVVGDVGTLTGVRYDFGVRAAG